MRVFQKRTERCTGEVSALRFIKTEREGLVVIPSIRCLTESCRRTKSFVKLPKSTWKKVFTFTDVPLLRHHDTMCRVNMPPICLHSGPITPTCQFSQSYSDCTLWEGKLNKKAKLMTNWLDWQAFYRLSQALIHQCLGILSTSLPFPTLGLELIFLEVVQHKDWGERPPRGATASTAILQSPLGGQRKRLWYEYHKTLPASGCGKSNKVTSKFT